MRTFLSDEAINLHKEYVRNLRLKYSILEKSVNGIKGKNIYEIMRQRLPRDVKEEALFLLSEIALHDCFFASFSDNGGVYSRHAVEHYGSVGAMLNSLYTLGLNSDGFLCVLLRSGRPMPRVITARDYPTLPSPPVLAVDLCEHTYFSDYRFDKRAYILAALSYLDLSRLDGE